MRSGGAAVLFCAAFVLSLSTSNASANRAAAAGKPPTCIDRLKRTEITFRRGPDRRGVKRPVMVELPLGGVSYVRFGAAAPQSRLFMDCKLALALKRMAPTLEARGINTVEHFGVYSYRCIANTDPCILSQHARATAIDLHEFRSAVGATYNVETDWIIEPLDLPTCSAPTLGAKNTLLHELTCEWDARNIFTTILTPNFNADHRNHFHVDLTPGQDFLR